LPCFTDECQLCMVRIGESRSFYVAAYTYHTLRLSLRTEILCGKFTLRYLLLIFFVKADTILELMVTLHVYCRKRLGAKSGLVLFCN
jgi:hypothetical protein